jgi:hypothetical protein
MGHNPEQISVSWIHCQLIDLIVFAMTKTFDLMLNLYDAHGK